MGYAYIFGTILFTVYGQIVIKWRVNKAGALPEVFFEKIKFLVGLLFDPFIFSGLGAALMAGFFWMAAMTKLDLSHAYPFMGATFVLVLLLSGFFFHEPITPLKVIGTTFIVLGIILGARG